MKIEQIRLRTKSNNFGLWTLAVWKIVNEKLDLVRLTRGDVFRDGDWVHTALVPTAGCVPMWDWIEALRAEELDPDTVGVWTGLEDKHGKDIYGGDLVHYGRNIQDEWIAEVAWDDEGATWGLRIPGGSVDERLCDWVGDNLEVIGSIHDKEEDNGDGKAM